MSASFSSRRGIELIPIWLYSVFYLMCVDFLKALPEVTMYISAIIAFNDYVALFVIKHVRNLNFEINQGIEFVSYSNLPLLNYIEYAPIASVE